MFKSLGSILAQLVGGLNTQKPPKAKRIYKPRPPGRSARTTRHIAAVRAELGHALGTRTDNDIAVMVSHYKSTERAVLYVALTLSAQEINETARAAAA